MMEKPNQAQNLGRSGRLQNTKLGRTLCWRCFFHKTQKLYKAIKTLENQPIMVKTITSKKVQITARVAMAMCASKTSVSHRFEKKDHHHRIATKI